MDSYLYMNKMLSKNGKGIDNDYVSTGKHQQQQKQS